MWPTLTDNGRPRQLDEVTPRDLGVHPSRFGSEGESLYITRKADKVLDTALTDDAKRLVIAQGPRLAGCTSTLAQAAQINLAAHQVVGFVDDPRVPLRQMIEEASRWAAKGPGAVLWLDRIGPSRITELAQATAAPWPDGLWILATADSSELAGSRIPEQVNKLLDKHPVRIKLGAITQKERDDLYTRDVYAELRTVLDTRTELLMGRLMVAWGQLHEMLTLGVGDHSLDRVALLRAVTDWYRINMRRLLKHDVLVYLYWAYQRELAEQSEDAPVSIPGFAQAMEWATAAATADRPQVIDLQAIPDGQRYAPHPLLGNLGQARRWWEQAAATGHPVAAGAMDRSMLQYRFAPCCISPSLPWRDAEPERDRKPGE